MYILVMQVENGYIVVLTTLEFNQQIHIAETIEKACAIVHQLLTEGLKPTQTPKLGVMQ